MSTTVQIALLLSTIAGLSTCIGGAVVFFSTLKSTKFLSFSMAFSAGVMIYVSFVEMLPHSFESLSATFGNQTGHALAVLLLFAGMLLIFGIDKLFPQGELDVSENLEGKVHHKKSLFKTGVLVAVAIAVHNFPEGIATFASSIDNLSMGVMITLAIAVHNIPEGIAVAAPIYYATGNKWKAFRYSFYSGVAEPIGALLAYLILGDLIGEKFLGYIMALIAGIMIYISFDFLLPSALRYGRKQFVVNALMIGMLVMALSLIMV